MDGAVLIDAVTATLADSCKDYCQAAIVALRFMKDTVTGLFGDWDKVGKNQREFHGTRDRFRHASCRSSHLC